jgi:hypothetical protein
VQPAKRELDVRCLEHRDAPFLGRLSLRRRHG